jgi:hypothetical protein
MEKTATIILYTNIVISNEDSSLLRESSLIGYVSLYSRATTTFINNRQTNATPDMTQYAICTPVKQVIVVTR